MTDTDIHNAMEDATADYAETIETLAAKLDGVHYTGIDFDQTMARFHRKCQQEVTRLYNSREPRG
ncbi:hypothetical protein [Corynebacterium sp.]|uniref:hypothetical protein n=1 Tax=Corynebacterium sp. TaxID=1720 RepID=UPI0028B13704|nr:hypothetical protein [Corynebacterium sp.]